MSIVSRQLASAALDGDGASVRLRRASDFASKLASACKTALQAICFDPMTKEERAWDREERQRQAMAKEWPE